MADTMIQRIARTMLLTDAAGVKLWKTEDGVQGYAWDFDAAAEMAKRILEEMRVPTIEMIVSCGDFSCSQQAMWERSIDAALAEGA